MEVGEKLRVIRKLKGFSQEELAEKLAMTRKSYANLENEKTKIDMPRLTQIAKVYGLELEELINFNEGKAFTNCFNNNNTGFFSAEKVFASTTKEERDFFMSQMQFLVSSFNEERKAFLEIIVNLKNIIEKPKN